MNDVTCASDLLRHELLSATVQKAAHDSDFYQRLYDGVDLASVRLPADLPKLPKITKEQVRAAGSSMLCRGQNPSHVQNTSGSTGPPLLLYRSFEEVHFIREFFRHVHQPPAGRVQPIVLALTIPHHGTPTPIPSHAFVLSTAVTDNELMQQSLTLLNARFDLPGVDDRVSVIAGSFSQLLVLTNYVHERGAPVTDQISAIEVTGSYLTRRWRSVLSSTWGCPIIDRYSLAEIFGGATLCDVCDGYHFDPHVVPEVVQRGGGEPVEGEEAGELLLTTLHPFVQYQPLIRYATGDIFARRELGCVSSSWTFMGRQSHCLFDPRRPRRMLVAGRTVLDAVDDLAGTARSRHYSDVTLAGYRQAAGRSFLKGTVATDGGRLRIRLAVELSYTPGLFPDEAADIRSALRGAVLSEATELQKDVDSGDAFFDIDLVPPGSLERVIKRVNIWEMV